MTVPPRLPMYMRPRQNIPPPAPRIVLEGEPDAAAAVAATATAMRAVHAAWVSRTPRAALAAALAIAAARAAGVIGGDMRAAAAARAPPGADGLLDDLVAAAPAPGDGMWTGAALRAAAALGGAAAAAAAAGALRATTSDVARAVAGALATQPQGRAGALASAALTGLAPLAALGPLDFGDGLPPRCVAAAAAYLTAVSAFSRGDDAGGDPPPLATFWVPAADAHRHFAAVDTPRCRMWWRGHALLDPALGAAAEDFAGDFTEWVSAWEAGGRPADFAGEIVAGRAQRVARPASGTRPLAGPLPAAFSPEPTSVTPAPESAWLESWSGFDLAGAIASEVAGYDDCTDDSFDSSPGLVAAFLDNKKKSLWGRAA